MAAPFSSSWRADRTEHKVKTNEVCVARGGAGSVLTAVRSFAVDSLWGWWAPGVAGVGGWLSPRGPRTCFFHGENQKKTDWRRRGLWDPKERRLMPFRRLPSWMKGTKFTPW